jgi:tRNA-Thr(GGU) m(6)t(6)A37 methyltransferase TsaA
MTTSRRQIARPGTTSRPVVAVQRSGVAAKQGGAGDELFAEELHCSAMPAAGAQTVLVQTSYGLVPIGRVQSALKVLDDAPNQREGAPGAWIRFDEQVAEGAKDLRPGDEIVVLTWLHLSPRDELSTHPQGDMTQPLTGVFSTCSPNRPNPIGLHRARILARDGLRIEVDALEAIDGTPVVDVKPAIDPPA